MQPPNLILDTEQNLSRPGYAQALFLAGNLEYGSFLALEDETGDTLQEHDTDCVILFDPPRTISPRLVGAGAVRVFAFKTTAELDSFDFGEFQPVKHQPAIYNNVEVSGDKRK